MPCVGFFWRGRRFGWAIVTLAALALCGLPLLAKGEKSGQVRVEGRPGSIRCVMEGACPVHNEIAGQTVRWVIGCSGTATVAPGLEAYVTAVPGGIAVDLPAASGPSVTWEPGEMTFRWKAPGAKGSTGTGLFDTFTPPAYPLGPGDKLLITVYNVPDMSQTVVVDPNSMITFPVLDKVSVKGLTVNDLQHKMEELLKQYVKEPQVNIQLLEYGSRYVNVLGEVATPGRIPLKGALKVLDAITQAGGFTNKAGDVEIQRADASGQLESKTFTQEQLLAGGGHDSNIYVLDQDVINVLPVKSIYVSGEVKSPGSFPYTKDITLLRAVALAGGFTQWAKKDRVDILREKSGRPLVVHVNASKIERGKIDDVPLQPDDHIVVHARKFF